MAADMGVNGDAVMCEITSVEDFNRAVEGNGGFMMVSSSVDFPEEYTSDPAVIALARAIRS